jgi:hypothetical protein
MHRSVKHLRDLFLFETIARAVRCRCDPLIFDVGVNLLSGRFGVRESRGVFLEVKCL